MAPRALALLAAPLGVQMFRVARLVLAKVLVLEALVVAPLEVEMRRVALLVLAKVLVLETLVVALEQALRWARFVASDVQYWAVAGERRQWRSQAHQE